MNFFKYLMIIIGLAILQSCIQGADIIDPATVVNPVEEFFVKGTIDGESFEIIHSTSSAYNQPTDKTDLGNNYYYYGTYFTANDDDTQEDVELLFGITAFANDDLVNIIQTGSYDDWYAFTGSTWKEVFVNSFNWQNEIYTSGQAGQANQDSNEFNITNVELLPNDENLDEKYNDRLYKVQGNFKAIVHPSDNINNQPLELIIDEFSAIFYDDEL